MGKNLIALSASDFHFHDWKQYNSQGERTQITINILVELFERSHSEGIPILNSGDLFHTPKGLTTKTLKEFNLLMNNVSKHYPDSKMVGITGNHDGSYENSLWGAVCAAFPKHLVNIDNGYISVNGINIYGLPYRKRNIGLVDNIKKLGEDNGKKILLIHTELYGAPDPSGYEAVPQNFSRKSYALFKAFDLVLAGHIHMHTKVKNNVYMVGAPNQQRKSDSGCKMGYLEIYDDFSVEFIPINAPEFKYYKEGEEKPDDYHFWVEIPKPKKMDKKSNAEFSSKMKREEMAKRYAKEKGIKNPKYIRKLGELLNEADD